MEFYQIILSYVLPALTGIGGAITSIIVCIAKVKSIAGTTFKENKLLKNQLAEAKAKAEELQETAVEELSEIKEVVIKKEEECKNLVKENISLKEALEAIKAIKDIQETLKQQITVLLKQGE